ncbi:chemotaxis protein CheC [Methanoplanus sp. FWC-SCC4]|uniref:Chemotaxis protein CheC n=1 Tax=Methanochimaera problematica TaxID=2609417 RepID=A0AA97I2V1_9EURY|nr:chemotaxis protein CheC [Methanoplanus sp. FWC-SCC4]WOF16680.1 chemotaxis protein CheC [Methanoplanus sp. FWC-SCC4]
MPHNFSNEDIDAVREILNIGIGRSAMMLNKITKSHITLSIPQIRIFHIDEIESVKDSFLQQKSAIVKLDFGGDFCGTTAVLFPPDSAAKLVMAITGEDAGTPELDSLRAETVKEIGNIILNGVMGSVGNILKTHIKYSVPNYGEDTIIGLVKSSSKSLDKYVLMATACFNVKDLNVEGNIVMLLEIGSMKVLLDKINRI